MEYQKEVINSQKELKIINQNDKELITKAKYGPSKLTRIPLNLDENLAFFIGAIIGDGHLKKNKFQITIELSNKSLIEYLKEICKQLFYRGFNIIPVKLREGKKPTFIMRIDSKAIYCLLRNTFEIPSGKKSHIVKIPNFIKFSDKKIKSAFLKGIMATEGGKRRYGFGLSTASEQLWRELIILFNEINIPVSRDKWEHKKYKKMYYGLSFRKQFMKSLMWECRSGQTGQP